MTPRPLPVARTRIVVPPSAAALLPRPRVQALLDAAGALPVVAVVAGAGFGKTSSLAAWAAARTAPTAWYSVAEGDDEEYPFLACLAASLTAAGVEGTPALELLGREGVRGWGVLDLLLSAMIDCPGLALVLDDVQRLGSEAVQEALAYLVRYLPPGARVLLGSRKPPAWREWRGQVLRGRAREIGAAELSLDEAETEALLERRLGRKPEPGQAAALREATGGWPLAVDVLARHGGGAFPSGSSERMDELLAEEIWTDLAPDEQEFLVRCSVLELLGPETAARVGGRPDGAALLAALARQGLFVQALPEGTWRVHQLFRDFLRRRLELRPEVRREAWRAAARSLVEAGRDLEAVVPWLEAGEPEEGRACLEAGAPDLLALGRSGRLLELSSRFREAGGIPGPVLLVFEGEALRQRGAFEEALERFLRAEELASEPGSSARAMRGRARVYVDTVQPSRARELLRRAFRTLPGAAREERAEVLDLLAENAVNEGHASGALRYRRWARSLRARGGPERLDARLLLRTGQLRAAREVLEARLSGREGAEQRPGEVHREEVLILAYIAAMEGDAAGAEARAREGLAVARGADSRPTEAVGWMRLGHALQLTGSPEALACYERASALVEATGIERLQAEVLMGQALLHAHRGEIGLSYPCATRGLAITRSAGDAWLAAWLRLAAGIAALLGGHPGAAALLEGAEEELRRCRDPLGAALARLWREGPRAAAAVREAGAGFLLERPTLFGPRVGLEALRQALAPAPVGAEEPVLRLQTLGSFRLWREGVEVEPRAWKRQKARELFLVLLTRRGSLQQKEALCDLLWPEASPQAANRDFRVALHALSEVLDPDRPRNEPARWIERRDAGYAFRPGPEVALDVQDFEGLARRARELLPTEPAEADRLMRRALALYRGDFLEDYPYADWAAPERERLRELYLGMAEAVAHRALETGDEELAGTTAHAILARDRCWEEAWRILMRLHLAQGRAFMALRVYEQCAQALEEELGVPPAPETEELHARASS